MSKAFEYLKNTFPKKYREIVLEHQAVNKVITFCDNTNQYLLFTGMFPEVNGGKGIAEELETYFVNFLVEKYNADAVGRAAAYVLEDQTSFIGLDIKGVDGSVWAQQNIFTVDDKDKVTSVAEELSNSSDQNNICTLVNTYFETIDFPEDTSQFLNNLYKQVEPQLQKIPLAK
tara:strand:+ start:2939 stop:3457 length:519 start_codon:yes stop_codon:yes gene_type:complete